LMTLIAALLPWLLLEQFVVPRRKWWLAALLPLLIAAWMISPIYEITTLWLCRAMLAMSLGIAGWAVWQRRAGSLFVLVGVLGGLLVVRTGRREFLDPSFFLTFSVLVMVVFAALGLQLRADHRRAQEALLTAARLEIEMLKKNIQPHFLMNTLTTIMEVIEQEPKVAVALIEALAVEFRILARVSGEKLIPLAPMDIKALITYKNGKTLEQEFYYGTSFLSQSGRFIRVSDQVASVELVDSKGSRRKINL